MMTHRILVLAPILLLIGAGGLFAQEQTEKYPPPHPPFVAAMPENAQWTLTVSGPEAASSANKTPTSGEHVLKTLASAKAGPLKQDVFTYGDNSTEEEWYMVSALLKADASDKSAVMVFDGALGSGGGDPTSLHGRGFPGVSWIKAGDFDKVARFQNKECYHFVRAGQGLEAWVDAETKLPVGCRVDGALYVYHFGAAPTSLTLPPAYQAAYDAYEKLRKHREQLQHDLGGH